MNDDKNCEHVLNNKHINQYFLNLKYWNSAGGLKVSIRHIFWQNILEDKRSLHGDYSVPKTRKKVNKYIISVNF